MTFLLHVVREVKRVLEEEKLKNFIIGYGVSPEEIHGKDIGYTYHESTKLIKEIIKEEIDYIHFSLWEGYTSSPVNSDNNYAQIFKEILDKKTKMIVVGDLFSEEDAQNAILSEADFIAIGHGTLIEPNFVQKIVEGEGNEIWNTISPATLNAIQ